MIEQIQLFIETNLNLYSGFIVSVALLASLVLLGLAAMIGLFAQQQKEVISINGFFGCLAGFLGFLICVIAGDEFGQFVSLVFSAWYYLVAVLGYRINA